MEAYRVQLRVRSSHLHVGRGPAGNVFRTSNEIRYLIGSADDAFVCCRHPEIKPHRCWIVVHEELGVEARSDDAPVLVNGTLIEDRLRLSPGDVLTVGPLELEVYFQETSEERQAIAAASVDPVEEEISEWLMDQDEAERERRKRDAKTRQYKLDPGALSAGGERTTSGNKENPKEKAPPASRRKKPGKLPQRPSTAPASPTSDAAAEGALKRIFTSWGNQKKEKKEE